MQRTPTHAQGGNRRQRDLCRGVDNPADSTAQRSRCAPLRTPPARRRWLLCRRLLTITPCRRSTAQPPPSLPCWGPSLSQASGVSLRHTWRPESACRQTPPHARQYRHWLSAAHAPTSMCSLSIMVGLVVSGIGLLHVVAEPAELA